MSKSHFTKRQYHFHIIKMPLLIQARCLVTLCVKPLLPLTAHYSHVPLSQESLSRPLFQRKNNAARRAHAAAAVT